MTDLISNEKITSQIAFEQLVACAESFNNKQPPTFLIDGTVEKNAAAYDFLKKYNFVCVRQAESAEFTTTSTNFKRVQREGHNAFAFLHQKTPRNENFQQTAEIQVIDMLEKEMSDFVPDATAHSQQAWDLRCNLVLRQFFSTIYTEGTKDISNSLLPSIESVLYCNAKDLDSAFAAVTLNYNPAWSRAPHVISAYHLHAHHTALQSYYNEYVEHTQSKKAMISLESDRNKQRWLHRLQKELILTAKKVILGKRATNQMVQDAAFHSKKESTSEKDAIEALRPLQAGYEAFVVLKSNEEQQTASFELIPGFNEYYPFYLACRRSKWANVGADCITMANDDEYSKAIFERCKVKIDLDPGTTLIISRTTPRRVADNCQCTLLPLSFRWQKYGILVDDSEMLQDNKVLDFAQICPFELALNATYQKSIADGIIYTSLPHLTGATQQFLRSTKKTSQSLKSQRQEIYNKWLSSLAKKSDRNSLEYHYFAPVIAPYLIELISQESKQLSAVSNCLAFLSKHISDTEKNVESAVETKSEEKSQPCSRKRKRTLSVAEPLDIFSPEYQKYAETGFVDYEMTPPKSIFNEEPLGDLERLMQDFDCF